MTQAAHEELRDAMIPKPERSLSTLFDIEIGIHEAMSAWQDAEGPEELAAAEGKLCALLAAELAKVDGFRRYMLFAEARLEDAHREAERQQKLVRSWDSVIERMKAFVHEAMSVAGKKRLDGKQGYFLLKGNGGLEPVTISDETMLPESVVDYVGPIPGVLWDFMVRSSEAKGAAGDYLRQTLQAMKRIPNNGRLRTALAAPCFICDGSGKVVCDHSNAVPEDKVCPDCDENAYTRCSQCSGTGKQQIAGARIEPRGKHVEVK